MQRAKYPGYAEHKVFHDKLTAQVVQFQTEFAAGKSIRDHPTAAVFERLAAASHWREGP
jgi:hypothetical protein